MRVYKHTVETRCKFCRSLFHSFNLSKVCATCEENMDQYSEQVKLYIKDYPRANYKEISDALDMPAALVKHILKEGAPQNNSFVGEFTKRCITCGKPVDKGLYCYLCEAEASPAVKVVKEKKDHRPAFHSRRKRR